MATETSSLPLGVRTVEWLRMNHFNWLVDDAEHVYYSWKAPAKGGPQLRALPPVGLRRSARPRAHRSTPWPRRVPLVFTHPLPGEGVWRPSGPPVAGAPPVLVTTFRTEPVYPRIVAYVAWFDHTRTQLALYPGRYEPPNASPRGPMEVPQSQRWRLLATFNSGFMNRDSHGGFFVDGHSAAPLRPGQGTIVAYGTGASTSSPGTEARFPARRRARAAEPAVDRRPRPAKSPAQGQSLWGSTLGNAVRVWRSGAGIDRHGNLIYAAADVQTVTRLAEHLMHAGAVRAIELDINAEWPSLITYDRVASNPTKVVPNYQQSTNRYLVPDDRDFFAVYRHLPGLVSVPLK